MAAAGDAAAVPLDGVELPANLRVFRSFSEAGLGVGQLAATERSAARPLRSQPVTRLARRGARPVVQIDCCLTARDEEAVAQMA
jgi:hypothetical protein